MGVQLPSFLGSMQCDIYYASYNFWGQEPEEILVPSGQYQDEFGNPVPQGDVTRGSVGQNIYGEEIKVWGMDRTQKNAYWNVMGTVNLQDLTADREFEYKKRLNGRFRYPSDPRLDNDGNYHPISSILVSNIIDKKTGQQLHLDENGNPIIFEVMSVDPFINPFGKTEYFKLLLERSDDQFMQLNGVIKKKGGFRVKVRS